MASKFVLRVERLDGEPVYLKPGGKSERDLKTAIISQVAKRLMLEFDSVLDKDGLLLSIIDRGVGVGRTQRHVIADVDAAIDEHEIRQRLAKAVTAAVEDAFQRTVTELKSDIEPVF